MGGSASEAKTVVLPTTANHSASRQARKQNVQSLKQQLPHLYCTKNRFNGKRYNRE